MHGACNGVRIERSVAYHDPGQPGCVLAPLPVCVLVGRMVVTGIVGGDPKMGQSVLLDAYGVGEVPHPLDPRHVLVAQVLAVRAGVVDFHPVDPLRLGQGLGRYGIMEVGMIDVPENPIPLLARIGLHQVGLVSEQFLHRALGLWLEELSR